jgi:hypothetical protein
MPKTGRERAIQPINREAYEPNGKTVVHVSKGDEEVSKTLRDNFFEFKSYF